MFWNKDVLRIFVKYLQRNSYFKTLQGKSHSFTKNEITHRSFLMNFSEFYLIVYRILRIQEHLFSRLPLLISTIYLQFMKCSKLELIKNLWMTFIFNYKYSKINFGCPKTFLCLESINRS